MGNDVLKIPRQVPVPLPLKYFNYGTGASSSTFWRGDGTWAAAPSGPTTGSWTPAPGSGAGITFSSVSAGYTLVGNLVIASLYMIVDANADGSNVTVSGLPFTSSGNNYSNAPGIVVSNNGAGTHALLYQCQPGTKSFLVYDAETGAHTPWSDFSGLVLSANIIYSTV